METFGRYSGISDVTDAQRLALDLTNYKPPLLVETTDNGTWKWLGGTAWVQTHSGGMSLVSPRSGTGARDRNRSLVNVTTRQAVHWPAGADIRNLTVFAMLEEGTTLTAGQELDVYAVLCVDAENDTEADGNLGTTSNPPSSATTDANFIPVPLGKFVSIPLTDALVNGLYGGGRVDVRSVDGTALNIWIGAN